jgi:hypothetical protein
LKNFWHVTLSDTRISFVSLLCSIINFLTYMKLEVTLTRSSNHLKNLCNFWSKIGCHSPCYPHCLSEYFSNSIMDNFLLGILFEWVAPKSCGKTTRRENWEEDLEGLSLHLIVVVTKISNWVTKVVDKMEPYTNIDTKGRQNRIEQNRTESWEW